MSLLIRVLTALGVLAGGAAMAEDKTVEFDFDEAQLAWAMGFADFPRVRDSDWGFETGYRTLPEEIGAQRRALYLAGNNHSDDLFMFATGAVSGLEPGASYTVAATFTIATNAADGCFGIGGSPGNSVYMKFGATTVLPQSALADDDYYRMAIDKGNQAQGGADAIVVGDIANSLTDCDSTVYELKTFDTARTALTVQASSDGTIWLLVGSDSGFEGRSSWYLSALSATLTRK